MMNTISNITRVPPTDKLRIRWFAKILKKIRMLIFEKLKIEKSDKSEFLINSRIAYHLY